MAALLVALAVMAVMMSVALPVWRHDAQREKEEELIFRGQQYVRAITLFNRKTNALPTRVDDLVQQRFLRKRYKDPITNQDFDWIGAGAPAAVQGSSLPGGRGTQQSITGGPPATTGRLGANSSPSGFGDTVPGGIQGVRSKSKDESIKLFLNRNHYNEWLFVYNGLGAGGGRGGTGFPGRQGGPGFPGRGGLGAGGGAGGGGGFGGGGGAGGMGGGTGFPGGPGFPGRGGTTGGRGPGAPPVVGPGGLPGGPGRGRQ